MLGIAHMALICVLTAVYVWFLYNLPILAAGIKNLLSKKSQKSLYGQPLPTFSLIVPVKNEEKVIGRLLTALSSLEYPGDKKEVVVIEDGSTDRTRDICLRYARRHRNVKVLHKPFSNGKPSALNYGIKHSKGEIIGIFDADNVPAHNALIRALRYFQDPMVAAIQGRTLCINSKKNMLTQFISYEEAIWCEAYLRGKDVLNLFVHLKGSCQFIKRHALERSKGFDESSLSEDMEISARFTRNDYKIRYAPDVRSWQESPENLTTLLKQRTRWFRGTMEVAFRYGRLMAKPSRKKLDAEITLFGPFILIASLLSYLCTFYASCTVFPLDVAWQIIMQFAALITTLTLVVCGSALVCISKPRKLGNLLWLLFVYFYWCLQAFIALYALLLIVLRRPKVWVKTEKKGTIALHEQL